MRTTSKDFPYSIYFKNEGENKIPYNYFLITEDTIIRSAPPQGGKKGYSYRWTGKRFVRFIEKGGNY